MRTALLLLCITTVVTAQASGSGLVVSIGSSLISGITNEIVYLCDHLLPGITFPDIAGDKNHGYPHIRYNVSEIKIDSAACTGPSGSAVPPSTMAVSLGDLDIRISSHLDAKQTDFPGLHAKGTLTIHVEHGSIDIDLDWGSTGGKPSLSGSAKTKLDTHLHFKGTDDGIVEPILFLLKPVIDGAINKAIDGLVQKEVAKASTALSSIPNPLPLGPHEILGLDWGLTASPSWSDNIMAFETKGDFGWSPPDKHMYNYTTPFKDNSTLPRNIGSDNLQIVIGQYTLDTLIYGLYADNKIQFTLTPGDIPSSVAIKLNTTDWKTLIPQLNKAYPDKLFEIYIHAAYYPYIKDLSNSSLLVTIPLDMTFNILPNKTEACTIQIEIDTSFDLAVRQDAKNSSEWNLYGEINTFKPFKATQISSNIGKLDLLGLNALLITITSLIKPIFNKALEKGTSFPKAFNLGELGHLNVTALSLIGNADHGYLAFEANAKFQA